LAEIDAAEKSFDAWSEWSRETDRNTTRLHYRTALRVGGVLGGGVLLHIHTPEEQWDSDVYGQITVTTRASVTLRLNPIEWRPIREHRNRADAPANHRFKTLSDRIHPFALNRRYGVGVFRQWDQGVAVEFPRAITRFEDYLKLCAEIWNCPDVEDIPPPPWSRRFV
jgi:hypothetical protein